MLCAEHAIQIGAYTGTVGTYEIIGGRGLSFHGVPVPNATKHVVLNLQIPSTGGQTQDLQVAVAGVSEQQLVSIVSSGLTAPATSTTNNNP